MADNRTGDARRQIYAMFVFRFDAISDMLFLRLLIVYVVES